MILLGATLSSTLSHKSPFNRLWVGTLLATQKIGDNKEVDRENTHFDDINGLDSYRLCFKKGRGQRAGDSTRAGPGRASPND